MKNIKSLRINLDQTLQDLILLIQASGKLGCALVYEKNQFINILTDGDIRRAILQKKSLDLTVLDVLNVKKTQMRSKPIVAPSDTSLENLKNIFKENGLRQLVLTNHLNTVVDVIHFEDVAYIPNYLDNQFSVLIMAGGFGTRLLPLTADLPKPMLLVGDTPMLEIQIRRFSKMNIKRIYISVHYLANKIIDYFGDGKSFGVDITYLHEDAPMGTGGCLRLIKDLDQDLLIINGDIVSDINYEMFHAHHTTSKNDITLASSQYNFTVPFGVIEEKNLQIISIMEKPSYSFLVNSGIYFINPQVLNYLPDQNKFDMTDLVEARLIRAGKVGCFPIFEKWLDIGRPSDYMLAENFIRK